MLTGDAFDEHVVTRLLDFFGETTSWQRRLWSTGSVLALQEVVAVHDEPVVFDAPRLAAKRSALAATERDPGLGTGPELGAIRQLLLPKQRLDAGGVALRQLSILTERARSSYLARWGAALTAGPSPFGAEHTARCLGAYLLDGRASPTYLHHWWTRHARKDPIQYSLADLATKAHEELVDAEKPYKVAVLFRGFTFIDQPLDGFVEKDDVGTWLTGLGLDSKLLEGRRAGGWEYACEAPDPGAAVRQAGEVLEAFRARIALLPHPPQNGFVIHPKAWVPDVDNPIRIFRRRRVEVGSLERSKKLFAVQPGQPVDSALELISHLDSNAPSAAVAGAWAGVESLLKLPDKDDMAYKAAERLAAIVACSFPRAELTTLGHRRINKIDDVLSDAWRALDDNRALSAAVADHIKSGQPLGLMGRADIAAEARMKAFVNKPSENLASVRASAADTLGRLYRLRNLVMHAGRTDAVGLRATLRVAAPLVGSGLDRISHAWFVRGVEPLQLVAQAEVGLGLADHLDTDGLVSILE